MSLSFAAIASGSNGNCYYIGNNTEAVLVDVGISAREVVKRMQKLNLKTESIKAIFISHEHSDHICGLQSFVKKFRVPVYITQATYSHSRLNIEKAFLHYFTSSQNITVGSLEIIPFSKLHDAVDPFSFVIRSNGYSIGVFTDIGSPCHNVINYFSQCHVAFLESNYDETMLANGNYPYHLKKRISSQHGHLSNKQALDLFLKYRPAQMSHLVLSHLSKNNNCPELVKNLFTEHAGEVNTIVASRYEPTEIFSLSSSPLSKTFSGEIRQMELAF